MLPADADLDKEIQDDDVKLDHIPDGRECRALLKRFAAERYFPNVYHINDHGNVDLLRLTTRGAHIVRSWV